MAISITEIALGLQLVSLCAVGIVVEKHYVSRVTGFTNGIAITIHVLTIPQSNPYLSAYAIVGFLLGAVGFLFYAFQESTGEWYNLPAFFLYSSWNVLMIIALPSRMWGWAIILGIGGQVLSLVLFGEGIAYFESTSYRVKSTVETIEEEMRRRETDQRLRELGFL